MIGALSLPLASVLTGEPEVIGSTVLAAAAASVRFDFPPVYCTVLLEAYFKRDANTTALYLYLNGDTGGNYQRQQFSAYGSSTDAARQTSQTQIRLDISPSLAGNQRSSASILIVKTTAAVRAQVSSLLGFNASPVLTFLSGEWNNTSSLLSRVDAAPSSDNFAANTSITLWGYRR